MATGLQVNGPLRGTGLAAVIRRQNLPMAGLAGTAILLGALVGRDVVLPPSASTNAAPQTASVAMGTVTNSVSATGQLVPARQVNLGFKTGGTLTEVDVRVGDHVAMGQVLAAIDPAPLQVALQAAQAVLASAQAGLSNTLNGTALTTAQHSLQQAQQSYNTAVSQAGLTNTADQAALTADQATLTADQAAVASDLAALTNSVLYQADLKQLAFDQVQLQNDTTAYNNAGCLPLAPNNYTPACLIAFKAIQFDQITINNDRTKATADQNAAAPSYVADQARIPADNAKISADNAKISADQATGQRSVEQAQNAVTNAQDAYNNQAVNRPATIQQQEAAVASADAQVTTAQSNLSAATLTSPTDGVITSVTAQAGDSVGATTASSGAEAPGTTAPLPASGSGSGTATAGSGFMVLMSDKAFQTVVSFAESDAAKIQAGQTGTVTFDAINGLTLPVHVLAVAASATVASNVVNYYVTLTLDSLDSRLKAGLTTNAVVVTARASNVLTVPNRALTRRGELSTVTLLRGGKRIITPVTLGVAGRTTTEVVSGVKEGDKVLLPTVSRTTTPTTNGGGRGFGGGGGAGLGLGG